MQRFIADNRAELIQRCTAKVAMREYREATPEQLANGVPLFLRQLEATLKAEAEGRQKDSVDISGASGGDQSNSTIGTTATTHGEQLFKLGYTIDQVVHDYGDICQAITGMAFEQTIPFDVSEFRTLNRCLDNAIADAVTTYSESKDAEIAEQHLEAETQRLGFLAHELRNYLSTAMLAFSAANQGALPLSGATGAVLRRSLFGMKDLIDKAIGDVREQSALVSHKEIFSLAELVAEAKDAAVLIAEEKGCTLTVSEVDPLLGISVDRDRVLAAIANVLQNAFKFTQFNTDVHLNAYEQGDQIHIDVRDHCGGLPQGDANILFTPFIQLSENKSGVGLGLSIARQTAENDHGTLTVQDLPGSGCVFTFKFPKYLLRRRG